MDIRSAKSFIRQTIPFYLAGAAFLLGMKYYYSRMDCGSLSWILSPTAWWVSALSGISFIKVPQAGYVSHSYRFIIAASCSGVRFLMISAAALVFSYIHRMRTMKGKLGWMALSALSSYLLTIFVNGFRILFSIFIPIYLGMTGSGTPGTVTAGTAGAGMAGSGTAGPGTAGSGMAHAWSIWLTPERLHTIIGAAVYFTALFAICQLGEYASRRCSSVSGTSRCRNSPGTSRCRNSRPRSGISPMKALGGWAVPSFWYFSLVLGIPFLNRAYRNSPGTFTDYALLLTAVCLTLVVLHGTCSAIIRHMTGGNHKKSSKHEQT